MINQQDHSNRGNNANDQKAVGQAGRGDPNLKLFIGGVPRTVHDDEYMEYFSSFGELDDCILMRDQDGVCRGFGFVTYRNQESYDNVMAAELQLRGTKLDQKKAVPRGENQEKKSNIKVFLGGLSKEVTKELIDEYFSQFGEVVDSVVMVDSQGISRGFGFVTFQDSASVDELMNNPKFDFHGTTIECKRAQPQQRINRAGRSRRGGYQSRRFSEGSLRRNRFDGGRQFRGRDNWERAGYNPRGFRYEQEVSYDRFYRNEFYESTPRGGYTERPVGSFEKYARRPMDNIYAYDRGVDRYRPY